MEMHTPPPSIARVFSPDKKNWFDIVDHGEYRMNAVKKEFLTSFKVEGVDSFLTIEGECCFRDNDLFVLWESEKILVYDLRNKVALHLTKDEMEEGFLFFDIKDLASPDAQLELNWQDDRTETHRFYEAFQLLKPGRGFV